MLAVAHPWASASSHLSSQSPSPILGRSSTFMPRWTVKATGFAMRSDPNEIEADKDAPYLRGWGAGATSLTAPGFRRSDPITTLPSSLLSGGWRGRRVRGPGVALLDLSCFLFLCVGSAHAPSLSPPSSGLTTWPAGQNGCNRACAESGGLEDGASSVRAGVAGSVATALAAAGLARGFQGHCTLQAPVGTAAAPLCHTFVPPPPWRFLKRLSSSQG